MSVSSSTVDSSSRAESVQSRQDRSNIAVLDVQKSWDGRGTDVVEAREGGKVEWRVCAYVLQSEVGGVLGLLRRPVYHPVEWRGEKMERSVVSRSQPVKFERNCGNKRVVRRGLINGPFVGRKTKRSRPLRNTDEPRED